jgi:hypothetical protein
MDSPWQCITWDFRSPTDRFRAHVPSHTDDGDSYDCVLGPNNPAGCFLAASVFILSKYWHRKFWLGATFGPFLQRYVALSDIYKPFSSALA